MSTGLLVKGKNILRLKEFKENVLKLKLPIFFREGKDGSPSLKVSQKEINSAKKVGREVERSLEGKLFDKQAYDKELD